MKRRKIKHLHNVNHNVKLNYLIKYLYFKLIYFRYEKFICLKSKLKVIYNIKSNNIKKS